ncbi:NTP transferase domain-containing protein [Agromyces sp. H66]|uniref:NTP transferase domain-containing protein n=1 Tax=Agromyces sp. H66 TaxID=2529859 RepID=UPI0010AA5D38|nr:NTP transferase domain-containing protein [Agromyces sp. H66]
MSVSGRGAVDAIILAGGRAGRLGGASKPDLVVGGRRLLATAIDAARSAGCRDIVVVGPPTLDAPGCLVVREDPPFGGPVAGLAAGLAALDPQGADVLVLACDMPDAGPAAQRLIATRTANPGSDGVCLVDESGREQWLAAIYSRSALDRAFGALAGDVDGASMRRLAASVDLVTAADEGTTHDIDTWDDLSRATRQEEHDMPETPQSQSPETLDRWLAALATELGIDPASVPVGVVLDLARDVAHGVARPAAPLSTFVVGLAVGAGKGSLAELSARATALAEGWSPDETA